MSRDLVAPALAIAATLFVQWTALRGDFLDDDFLYFYDNAKWGTFGALLQPYGNHFMATFRIIVGSLQAAFRMHPLPYFAVVLATHVAHVALLYGIVRAFSGSRLVAAVTAGLWGSAPAFQGTLVIFGSYAHMLTTTVVLWPLWEMARAAEAGRPPTPAALLRANVVLLCGAATAVCGAITAALFPAVAWLVLPRASRPLRTASALLPAAVASVALVACFGGVRSATFTTFPVADTVRAFFLFLAYGVGLVAAGPFVTVHGAGEGMGVFASGSCEAAVAVSAAISIVLFPVVVWRLVCGDWTERCRILALVGLAAALYGGIAIGRTWLRAGNSLSWLATRDRYHYDANAGLIIAIAVAIARIRLPAVRFARPGVAVAAGLMAAWIVGCEVTALAAHADVRTRERNNREFMDRRSAAITALAHAAPEHGVLYVRNDPFAPAWFMYLLGASKADFPGTAGYWIIAHGVGGLDGRTIRFVDDDAAMLAAIRATSLPEVTAMFVTSQDVARAGATTVGIADGELLLDGPPPVTRRNAARRATVVARCHDACAPNDVLGWTAERGCRCAPPGRRAD